jgi:excinuclease ABC subunit A
VESALRIQLECLGTKHLFSDEVCKKCEGKRLRDEALYVFLAENISEKREAKSEKFNITNVTNLSIKRAIEFFANLKLSETDKEISKVILKEIEARLKFMNDVGIEYLQLNRQAHTLSGGEAQRTSVAT